DVYYVPKLRSNILSLGQLVKKRPFISRNRMFTLSIKNSEAKCLKTSIKDETRCWHMRFGRLNIGALKTLGDEKMVKGCLTSTIPINYVKHVSLVSMQKEVFLKKLNQEQMSLFNLCTLMGVVQLILFT
ncbi:hypothetical protein CR513_13181, partial [Mucuna pruriens]